MILVKSILYKVRFNPSKVMSHEVIDYLLLDSIVSDSKSCLSGLNWPRSGKKRFLALFGLVEGTLGIGWK